jgi:hypothetical protein
MNLVELRTGEVRWLRDCTARTVVTPLDDQPFTVFVEQMVRFGLEDGAVVIESVEVLQDGWTGEGGVFGCVPGEYRGVAEEVATVFQQELLLAERDPARPLSDALVGVVSEPMRGLLEGVRSELIEGGRYSDSPTVVVVEAVGLNFGYAMAAGPVVRVGSCVGYPEGQVLRRVGDGEVVEEVLAAGSELGFAVDVVVRADLSAEVVAVVPSEGECS